MNLKGIITSHAKEARTVTRLGSYLNLETGPDKARNVVEEKERDHF